MNAGNILRIVPGLQATSIMGMSVPKMNVLHPKKISAKPLIKGAVGIMTGVALLQPTAAIIGTY